MVSRAAPDRAAHGDGRSQLEKSGMTTKKKKRKRKIKKRSNPKDAAELRRKLRERKRIRVTK